MLVVAPTAFYCQQARVLALHFADVRGITAFDSAVVTEISKEWGYLVVHLILK